MGSIFGRILGGVFGTLLGIGTGYLISDSKRICKKNTIGFACGGECSEKE